MDQQNEQRPHPGSREKRLVPHPQQLAKANFLALYWQKPLSDLAQNGEPLPGIQGRFLPDNPEELQQTLGQFLSGGDETLTDFASFQQLLQGSDKDKAKRIVREFKNLCPSPKELFDRNPHLLNWVPWEAFIAYGDLLQSRKHREAAKNKVTKITEGDQYLEEARTAFPKGFPKKRTEIVLERQNKDPKTQGILEAVSNSIDAISEREKIGQFGLGVKQVFAWLEQGKGEVNALTRTKNGQILAFHARKGYDDQIYVKFSKPTPEEKSQFKDNQTGTVLTISGLDISPDKQQDLTTRIKDRFRYVPETAIAVNATKINGYDAIKAVGRTHPITPHGEIDVSINDSTISIRDNGSGMSEETMFRMFLPGHGKGYNPLSAAEAKRIAHEQAEVLLIEEEQPRIVFSRNREADFALDIPTDRLNTSSKTICLELGRILKVSEGREGFEIDDNFADAVGILVKKTLADEGLTPDEKTTFLNSLVLGIDQLSGVTDASQEDKTATIVRRTKSGIRKQAVPYLQELRKDDITLLPNYALYEKIVSGKQSASRTNETQYVDPYLLEGVSDIASLLEKEGFNRLKGDDGVNAKSGWKILTANMRSQFNSLSLEGEGQAIGSEAQARRGEGAEQHESNLLHELNPQRLRQHLTDILPVVIDKDHRVVILDQTVWQTMEQEQDPVKKAYLQETIQTIINEKVLTSYEAEDPRAIMVQDKKNRPLSGESKESLTQSEREALRQIKHTIVWSKGDKLYDLDGSGTLKIFDANTRELKEVRSLPELAGKVPFIATPTEDRTWTDEGIWILTSDQFLFFLDQQGNVRKKLDTPRIDDYTVSNTTLTSQGNLASIEEDSYMDSIEKQYFLSIFIGLTQEEYSLPLQLDDANHSAPHPMEDGTFLIQDGNQLLYYDGEVGLTIASNSGILTHKDKQYTRHTRFITFKDDVYLLGIEREKRGEAHMGLFKIDLRDDTPEANFVTEFSLDSEFRGLYFNVFTDPSSGRIGIETKNNLYFLREKAEGFELEAAYQFSKADTTEEASMVLPPLKKLFGDDPDTSYTDAIAALTERLNPKKVERIENSKTGKTPETKPKSTTDIDFDEIKRVTLSYEIGFLAEDMETKKEKGISADLDEWKHTQLIRQLDAARTSEDLDKLLRKYDIVANYKKDMIYELVWGKYTNGVIYSEEEKEKIGHIISDPFDEVDPKNLDKLLDELLERRSDQQQPEKTPKRELSEEEMLGKIAKYTNTDIEVTRKDFQSPNSSIKGLYEALVQRGKIEESAENNDIAEENKQLNTLLGIVASPEFREKFNGVWEELRLDQKREDSERLKMRFVRNAPLLLDLQDQEITSDQLALFFYADNPQVFFEQDEKQQQQLAKNLQSIDSLPQRERLVQTVALLTDGKTPDERDLVYGQLEKIFDKERFRDTFLRVITQNSEQLAQAASRPEELEITDPLRSYFLFLTNQAEMIRTKEILPAQGEYENVLPRDIPLELLAHFRLVEGLTTMDEMRQRIDEDGGLEHIMQTINLSHYQDEIRKAIHAQATEAGIEKRELLQNSFDAIRKRGTGEGKIAVDFYLRNGGEEFVEEVRDTGTGIDNLVAFLVPGVTTKEGTGEQGFFGTGFYKNLEDVDSIEVDSVVQQDTGAQARRVIIDVVRNEEGAVSGGVVRQIATKPQSSLTESGTTIRLVKKTADRLPELEAMVAKNTYVTMGGLATVPELSDTDLDLVFLNEEGQENPVKIPVVDRTSYDIEDIGKIMFVKAPTIPPLIASAGLRMSLLSASSSEYLEDVPKPLKNLLTDERVSIVLPKTLPLVKDRSRLANEETSLPAIQQTIATEAIKRAAYLLLSESTVNIRGEIPEDILSNSRYYQILTSDEGQKAYAIAQKINLREILDADDFAYINEEQDIHPLVLVLLGIEQTSEDGKKDSLLRRHQYIQEKAGNKAASSQLARSFTINSEETEMSPQLAREEKRVMALTEMSMDSATKVARLEQAFNTGNKPEDAVSLAEAPLQPQERELLTNYFTNIGFEEVYFIPQNQLGAGGVFTKERMYLNADLLTSGTRQRLETIIHESSHLFEMRAGGIQEGSFDTEEQRKNHFTHQQEGPFADYYKIASTIIQQSLV